VHIYPLLESLASLETTCREAVECLDVLAYRRGRPEYGNLEKLQELFGGDGKGGHQETVRQLIGIVGHCLNARHDRQDYRVEVIKDMRNDGPDGFTEMDGPYIEGSTPHTITAENAAAAAHTLLVQSRTSLTYAVAKATGGGLFEVGMTNLNGRTLPDDFWQRLSGRWCSVMAELRIPSGLELSGLSDAITTEIEAAKHLLTFGPMTPNVNATSPETTSASSGTKTSGTKRKKNAPPVRLPPSHTEIVRELIDHHFPESADKPNRTSVVQADLVRTLDLGKATVSGFFKQHFRSHEAYENLCDIDPGELLAKLATLSVPLPTLKRFRNLGSWDGNVAAKEQAENDD
jgi:hypothetical protein